MLCGVIVAFRDLANVSKKLLGSGPLTVIRYREMHAGMQNETLANTPNYVAICAQHITHVFYQPGLNAWLLRTWIVEEVC